MIHSTVIIADSRAPYLSDHKLFADVAKLCEGIDISDLRVTDQWLVPLDVNRRDDHQSKDFNVVGKFLDFRSSPKTGHLHTGVDLRPKKVLVQHDFPVLAAAPGIVCATYLPRPQQSVVLAHKLKDGTRGISVYKHLQAVNVRLGDRVDVSSVLGIAESSQSGFGPEYAHLHFEIRKDFSDGGLASYTSMTEGMVSKYFVEPFK